MNYYMLNIEEITNKLLRRLLLMLISVCIGSACHLKGSYDVIDKLQELVEYNDLGDQVELKAVFCLGNCQNGVSVKIDEEENVYSVTKKTVNTFFEEVIKTKLTA